MHGTATERSPLLSLAGRLTEPGDRETYAALISFIDKLSPTDELFRLAQLLGFLTLIGARLPDALTELLTELQKQSGAASEYHQQINERLLGLPDEIAQGVDPAAIAKAMSEVFRQQIATSGLQDTAAALKSSVAEIKALSGQLTATLKPVAAEYKSVSAMIAADVSRLTATANELQTTNAGLIVQTREHSWLLTIALGVLLFVLGTLAGIVFGKNQTASELRGIRAQLERMQTPIAQPPIVKKTAKTMRAPGQ